MEIGEKSLIEMAARIVEAYVKANHVLAADIPSMVSSVYATLGGIAKGEPTPTAQKPAVPIKKSVSDNELVCLEDGKHLTMLKRYLRTHYNMSPDQYRQKWDLPHDYPMVAPAYARLRSGFAKKFGLGRVGVKARRRKK